MRKSCLMILLIGLAVGMCHAQDRWAIADSATVRLSPTSFTSLPKKIVKYLSGRGGTIPQTYMTTEPHNVISGEFAKQGQTDWAVLCSRNRKSSIVIFWRGSTNSISELANSPDKSYLQTITGDGTIGFSRAISTVGKDYIKSHYDSYGGPRPPRITHQGINVAFVEKASVVLYFYRGRWLELQGAD